MFCFILFSLLSVAAGNVVNKGKCSDPSGVANFNVNSYAGTWYEISKYPNDGELNGKCPYGLFAASGDSFIVNNTIIVDHVQTSLKGTAKFRSGANKSAKLVLSLKAGTETISKNLTILATDYKKYAVTYICVYNSAANTHQDFAWVLSKSKTLDTTSKAAVATYLASSTLLKSSLFVENDFSEDACRVTKKA